MSDGAVPKGGPGARKDRAERIALFRYQLIREAADDSVTCRQRGPMVRALAATLKRERPARTAAQITRIMAETLGDAPSESTLLGRDASLDDAPIDVKRCSCCSLGVEPGVVAGREFSEAPRECAGEALKLRIDGHGDLVEPLVVDNEGSDLVVGELLVRIIHVPVAAPLDRPLEVNDLLPCRRVQPAPAS